MPTSKKDPPGTLTEAGSTAVTRFDFAFDDAHRVASLPFGVTPRTTAVVVDADQLRIRFGPWFVRTSLDNVTGMEATGPYSFLKTAGPARLSLVDRGLTFATNGERGLCIRFAEPVAGIEPSGRIRHPAVTVTVADPDGLAATLRSRQVTGGSGR